MASALERAPLRLGSIEISERGIAEYTRDGHRTVLVARSSIQRVTVDHGFTCERPIATLLGAAFCLGLAGVALWFMIASFLGGGNVRVITVTAVLAPATIGLLCLWTLVRRGRYLRIATERDSRKLVLRGGDDRNALREFLNVGRSRFGYDIELTHLADA
jgi:hypothetical protein